MTNNFAKRQIALRRELASRGLDALLVTQSADWYYLTGFTGESGALVIGRRRSTLITDGRFTTQANGETRGVQILQHKAGLYSGAGEFLKRSGFKRVGFDSSQVTVAQHLALRKASGTRSKLKPVSGLVLGLRMRKDAQELAQMRKAAVLASEVVEHAIGMLKPGVRELEIAAEIEFQMRRRGASGPAFESIVAFGERAALPHARPTAKQLRKNELVVLDLGAILGHYCSDITRTVYVGTAPKRIKEWYKAVLEAQSTAIAAVRQGVSCGDVDAAARSTLAGYKLDRYFVHSTGHGLGLEVHEDPRVARDQKARLEPGTVITIEPGVYVPGVGGIRIEDDVAVHEDRSEILTRAPRDFMEL
ncbi:MAG TPA: Xaa-Pro peptidase family protein [Candidatus Dormibacteraeota bacterium]|jgi:Xaa-Pro aminopeptidase|nr:Xaa-Pro peptidase family protein [Candidatus Dormibacteraeota bacterium]